MKRSKLLTFRRIWIMIVPIFFLGLTQCDWENILAYVAEDSKNCSKVMDEVNEIWNSPFNSVGHLATLDEYTVCSMTAVAEEICVRQKTTVEMSLIIDDNFPDWSLMTMDDLIISAQFTSNPWVDSPTVKSIPIRPEGQGIWKANEVIDVLPESEDSNFGNILVTLMVTLPSYPEPFMDHTIFEAIITSARINIIFSH